MRRAVLGCLLLVGACGPNYQPTELPWKAHAVAAGGSHTLVMTEVDGAVSAGTIEQDGTGDVPLPQDPSSQQPIALVLPTATAVAVGSAHACIVSSGQVTCWGSNTLGAVGAHRACTTDGCALAPEVMPTLPPMRAVAAGDNFTCATATDSTVMCWGDDSSGQLGGSQVPALDPPRPIMLPTHKPLYADRVNASGSTACAIDEDQQAWCWGAGYGEAPVMLPHGGVIDVAVNEDHGCVLAADGLTCWGDNINGQIDATAARACTRDAACELPPTKIAGDATRVVVGARHTCTLDHAGNVTCWGSNEHGQLASSDSFLVGDPNLAFTGAVNVVSGYTHVCAIDADHGAWCWGDR